MSALLANTSVKQINARARDGRYVIVTDAGRTHRIVRARCTRGVVDVLTINGQWIRPLISATVEVTK